LNAFLVALFGAICWGIAPMFGKVGLRGLNSLDGLIARTMITVLFVAGLAFSNGFIGRINTIPIRRWYFLAAEAFLATFAGDLAYYAAIKKGEIGETALILAASPLVTLWIGWYFLGESLSPLKLIGAALIIIGVVLVGFNPAH
jgi:transporter family protein